MSALCWKSTQKWCENEQCQRRTPAMIRKGKILEGKKLFFTLSQKLMYQQCACWKSKLAYTKHEHFSEITLFYGCFGNHVGLFYNFSIYKVIWWLVALVTLMDTFVASPFPVFMLSYQGCCLLKLCFHASTWKCVFSYKSRQGMKMALP